MADCDAVEGLMPVRSALVVVDMQRYFVRPDSSTLQTIGLTFGKVLSTPEVLALLESSAVSQGAAGDANGRRSTPPW